MKIAGICAAFFLAACVCAGQAGNAEAQQAARGAQEAAAAVQRASTERQRALARPVASSSPAGPGCQRLPEAEAAAVVASASTRAGVSAPLLHSVIERESGFRPCAVSSKGAMGLMQLMPSTAGELGLADLFDPLENAGSGARYLARLLGRYDGDLRLALAAYNAGPARVDATGGVPDIPETRAYVRGILASLGLSAQETPASAEKESDEAPDR